MRKIKLNEMLDLPADTFEACPSFLLVGQKECIIEGKCKLVAYGEERIAFDIFHKGKYFVINGTDLTLSCLSSGNCSVRGRISSVGFEGVK